MPEKAILIDASDCTGCNSCTYKCIQEFGSQEQAALGLFRTVALINDRGVFHQQCMHCKQPPCLPVAGGAITVSEYGAVLLDSSRLADPVAVAAACPFHVLSVNEQAPGLVKCNMCAHRVSAGRSPACVEACPVSAIHFGDYEEMVATARRLARGGKLKIYGLKECGGTRVIFVTKGDPIANGYPRIAASRKPRKPAARKAAGKTSAKTASTKTASTKKPAIRKSRAAQPAAAKVRAGEKKRK